MAPQQRNTTRRRKQRTQKERAEAATSALIEATISALSEVGYSRTSTQEIVRRAGCTTGTLQHHFASKSDLYLAVLDSIFDKFKVKFEKIPDTNLPLVERCRTVLEALWDIYSGQHYLATSELQVGTRGDANLHQVILNHKAESMAAFERFWYEVFSDVLDDKAVLTNLLHFTLSLLRGLVYYNHLDREKAAEFYAQQLEILEQTLVYRLTHLAD